MSDNNFNVSALPIVPSNLVGSNSPKNTKVAEPGSSLGKVSVPGIFKYNPETGGQDKVSDWSKGKKEESQKEGSEKTVQGSRSDADKVGRHQEWKNKQQEKKEARQAAKTNKAGQQQLLALDALKSGNISQAAQALNTTVADLLALVNNAALSIPTKPVELTPEQKRAKDEADYRASLENRLKDAESYKYEATKYQYIKETIDPVFNAKDQNGELKYELLNNVKDPNAFKHVAYEYMNQHYVDTFNKTGQGEVLDIQDVLDTMESQLSEEATSGLERFKNIKKFSKYFNAAQEEEVDSQEDPEEEMDLQQDEEDDYQAPVRTSGNVYRNSLKNVPFALQPYSEKRRLINSSTKRK